VSKLIFVKYWYIVFTARPHCLQCRTLYKKRQFRLSVCLSVRPSVRLSDTRWYPIQTNEDRIMRSSPSGSKNTLVFWYQQWLGQHPIPPKICAQSDLPSLKSADTLPLSLPKGTQKVNLSFFVNKNQFKSNKLCYKVFLCENFQWQSRSRTISLSNGVYMLAVNVTLEPNI